MKKFFSILMSALLVLSLVGCGGTTTDESASLKLGFGAVANIAKSKDAAADADGLSYGYVTQAGVLVDADGKITKIVLDSIQAKANFDATGAVTSDLTVAPVSKKVLGDDYGMKETSADGGLGLEWFEQAANFEAWAVGKTVEDLQAAVNEEGYPADTDLATGVSVDISSWIAATVLAMENAVDSAATAEDTLKLGTTASISEKDIGKIRSAITFAAYTLNGDDVITASIVDAMNIDVLFDETGKITSDLTTTFKTKLVLKEEYGMKETSAENGIGLEWYEQSNNYSAHAVGKKVADLAADADEEGNVVNEDLSTKVSVVISGWIKAFENGIQ
ncbi:MAG: hypothetical protein ACK5G7_04020 [Erysipelotrichaceae bacterium]